MKLRLAFSAWHYLIVLLRKDLSTQQIHQRWINIETTLIVNAHRRCFVDIWLKMKVELTYIFRRCFHVEKITLKQRRQNYVDSTSITKRFNVDIWLKMKVEPTYVYRRCFNVVLSTFSIELRRFNVDDSMLLKRRYLGENDSWTNACLPALFWLWYLLYWCSLSRGSITKLNYVFKHTVKHIFLL